MKYCSVELDYTGICPYSLKLCKCTLTCQPKVPRLNYLANIETFRLSPASPGTSVSRQLIKREIMGYLY